MPTARPSNTPTTRSARRRSSSTPTATPSAPRTMPTAWSPRRPSPTALPTATPTTPRATCTSATDAQGNVTTFVYGNAGNPDLLDRGRLPRRHVAEIHLQHRRPAHPERRPDRLHRQLHLRRPGPVAGIDRRQRQPDRPVHLRRRRQPDPEEQRQRHLHGLHLRRRRRRARASPTMPRPPAATSYVPPTARSTPSTCTPTTPWATS